MLSEKKAWIHLSFCVHLKKLIHFLNLILRFQGKLPSGVEIVVKRFTASSTQDSTEFTAENNTMANLQHRIAKATWVLHSKRKGLSGISNSAGRDDSCLRIHAKQELGLFSLRLYLLRLQF